MTDLARATLSNGHVRVEIDRESGRYGAVLPDDSPVLLLAEARAFWSGGSWSSSDPIGRRSLTQEAVEDAIGTGIRATLTCTDPNGLARYRTILTTYDGLAGFTIESILTNTGPEPLNVKYLIPCAVSLEDGAALYPVGPNPLDIQDLRMLTNGYLYSDPGRVERFGSNRWFQSRWNVAIAHPASGRTLVAGYISHEFAETELVVGYDLRVQPLVERTGLDFEARSHFGRQVVVPPGQELSSDALLFTWAATSDAALGTYGRVYAKRNGIQRKRPIMGWCSWYYTYRDVSQDEVLLNAKFVAVHLKDFGVDVIQIDDGYQRGFGDWEGNEEFPNGMGWLAEQIRGLGLRPGIWVAPYVVDRDSVIAQEHPEWLGRGLDGGAKHSRNRGTINQGRGEYGLDATHPEARAWLYDLFHRIGPEWGYELVKLDLVEFSLLAIDRYHDPTMGRAGAYRHGLRTIRDAIGPERHILDCGPLTAAGITDSWRIERDFDRLTWRQYTKERNSNAPAIAKRYYLHNNLWSNDPDHLGLALLTEDQGRAVASIIALSGGTIISGDRLYALPESKLAILRSVLPVYGEAAVPLDLFESDFPALFHLRIERSFGAWEVLGLFNWSETGGTRHTVPLARLGLDPGRAYFAHEFWDQRPVPVVEGAITVDLAPSSCAVIAIRPVRDQPDVAGTDRHVLQGAVELADLRWDAADRRLSGVLNAVAGTRPALTLSVPTNLRPIVATVDGSELPFGQLRNGLLPIVIPAPRTGPQEWSVTFGEVGE